MQFNYLNAVNVFTDASNLPAMNGRKENIICPAYIVSTLSLNRAIFCKCSIGTLPLI